MTSTEIPTTSRRGTTTGFTTDNSLSARVTPHRRQPTQRQLLDRQGLYLREQRDLAWDNHSAYEERTGHMSLDFLRRYREYSGLYAEFCRDYEREFGSGPPTTPWGVS